MISYLKSNTFQKKKMKVLKFGGTSLGTPQRMQSIVPLVYDGHKNIVVLSAVSGTTNQLVQINQFFSQGDTTSALNEIEAFEKKYDTYIEELLNSESKIQEGKNYVASRLEILRNFTQLEFGLAEERIALAQGELISTYLFKLNLDEKGINSTLLSALDFMSIDENHEPRLDYIKEHLSAELEKHPESELFITQGYICRNHLGEIDNLKRGGSDYTASLIGAALHVNEIQIWTDIDGMQNNDPRFVSQTKSISEMSFDEAAELAYFGAKILHPACILPAKKENVPVRLKNTMNPSSTGTFISAQSNGDNIKAIAAKDGIVAIKIKSARMLMAYGFLKQTFEVFEKYKTSIDTVTTSEVAVSLTIDDLTYLDQIKEELSSMASVEIDTDLSIICIVGDFLADKPGYLEKIFKSLVEIPIRMVSYGGSKNNITLLVKTSDKKKALVALNEGVFELMEKKELEYL